MLSAIKQCVELAWGILLLYKFTIYFVFIDYLSNFAVGKSCTTSSC